jgi:hypothetical protein
MKTLTAAVFGVALFLCLSPSAFADSTGLVAAYGFEETSGTGALDSSGAGNAGVFNGATRFAAGRFGAAASFDGVNDRIDVADSNSLDLSSGMTLEAWVQPTSAGWRTAIMKERPGGIAYALYESTDSNRPSVEIQQELRGTSAVPAGVWSHLATTYDGATLRLYVNGTQVASRAVTGSITLSSGALRLGGNAVWGEYFGGLMDEVRIYNRPLTAAEIGTDMNRAVVGVAADTEAPSAPTLSGTVTQDDVHLSWSASTDNVGVKEYRVYRDGALVATRAASIRVFDEMDRPAGTQRYTLLAVDDAGNTSAASNELTLTVAPDTTPPSLTVSAVGAPPSDNFCAQTPVSNYVPLRVEWSDARGPVPPHVEVDGITVRGPFTSSTIGGASWDFETIGLSNGLHTSKAIARDGAGNEAVRECTWTVQNPDYAVQFSSPADGATVNGIVSIQAGATADGAPSTRRLTLSGAPGATETSTTNVWTWNTAGIADGDYAVTANLYMPSYEAPRATSTIHVKVDNTPPAAPSLNASMSDHDVHLTWTTASDPSIKEYRVYRDGTLIASPTSTSYDDLDRPDGSYTYKVVAVDRGGLTGTSREITLTVGADTTPPTGSLGNCNGLVLHDYATLMATFSDDRGPVTARVYIDGVLYRGPYTRDRSGSIMFEWELLNRVPDGLHMLTLALVDGAGNEATVPCEVNVRNPTVTAPFVTPSDGDTVSGTVKVSAKPTWDNNPPLTGDTVTVVSYYVDGVAVGYSSSTPYEVSWDTTKVSNGLHTLKAEVYWMDYGAPRATQTMQVRVDNTPDMTPPTVALQAGCDGRALNDYIGPIRGTATDDGGRPVTVTVDVADQRVFGPEALTDGNFTFYWDTRKHANGPVVMKVTARDAAGNETVKDCPWTVNNAALSVPITGAADGDTVSGTVTLGFQPRANGVPTTSGALLQIDGAAVASTGSAPYTYSWDTTKVANGVHTIKASMYWLDYPTVMATATLQVTVSNAAPPPAGLVAAYGFEQTSGTSVTDSSGKGSTGTLSGATWVADGKSGRALSFDGVNDIVTVPDSNLLDLAPGMTLEAWVKPTTVSGWRTVMLKERPSQLAYALYATGDNGRPLVETFTGASREARGTAALPVGTWTHLAATYDKSTLKLYVNGTLVSSTAFTGTLFNSTGALRIGGNTVWGEYFGGLIDDVRVYERALSAAEIAADKDRAV